MFVHNIARLSTSPVPQPVENHARFRVRHPQTVDNSWGRAVDAWGQQPGLSTDDGRPVGGLLKVLGTTAPGGLAGVHSTGEKPGGLPVDNRWTTVDNLGIRPACGPQHRFTPRFSTANPPVDNLSDLGERGFSTVCTGAMKTMSYLF
jgi:hypothetical protein